MTTDTDPLRLISGPVPLRPRLANQIMRLSSRIGWAEPELRGLKAVVRLGDHVFDVGAAHGMYTIPLAHFVGAKGQVHSFEPHPRQQRTLHRIRRLLGAMHINVNPSAVGAEQGHSTMRLPIRHGFPIYGHAHVAEGAESAPEPENVKHWRTPMYTVDSWCELNGIESVTFMKVDVEGFEPNVVAGATRTIEQHRPSMLLEIEDRHLGRYGRDANQFADEIRERWPEYRMYSWSDESWKLTERVLVGVRNYLFATDAAFARAS